jgi:hypothetical protein
MNVFCLGELMSLREDAPPELPQPMTCILVLLCVPCCGTGRGVGAGTAR